MQNKLEKEDFYHQFHGAEHHVDSSSSDMSLMDFVNPRNLYKTGRRVDVQNMFRRGGSVVDHALSLTRHTALHGMQHKRGRP